MEYAGSSNHDSYTRYRMATAAVMQQVAVRDRARNMALLVAISAFWGYVVYVALAAMV